MAESKNAHKAERAPGAWSRWLVPIGIVAVMALLVLGVFWMTGDDDGGGAAGSGSDAGSEEQPAAIEHPDTVAEPDLSSEEARDPDDLMAMGEVDAPVVMIFFTDVQCPYCASWVDDTLPVMQEYVDRGELRIEWRDVNVYGEDSERGARASVAAAMQGEVDKYHRMLFEGGEIRSSAELSEDALVEEASELGMDPEQFRADMNSEEVAEIVDTNAQQGIDLGAMSTPSFVIGGTPAVGAQPTEVFTEMVDEALVEAEG